MLLKKVIITIGLLALTQVSHAQFGLPSIPGLTSGSSASSGNAADVLKNANTMLLQFIRSEIKLAEALSGYRLSQEQQDFVERLSKGDVAKISKDDLSNAFTIDAELKVSINKTIEAGGKIAENQKKLAAEGFFEYLKALLSSKVVIDSVQGLAKNPTALGFDSIGPITTLASNLPKMISQSTSSTTTIIKYLSASGIDTSKMQKEADSLGK